MAPAILFWFYRDADLCENRLRVIRRFNPHSPIYGLYGGPPAEAEEFRRRLGDRLDDFYVYDGPGDAWWKWINGDLVIREWYRSRGHHLPWRSIVIHQWDMLVLGSLGETLGNPAEDEVILSGLRPVAEVEEWWPWVREESRAGYEAYMRHMVERVDYREEAWCCQFVLACFGRRFLEEYSRIEDAEIGFIEYRVPTYARAFGMRLSAPRAACWWEGDPSMAAVPEWRRILSARHRSVSTRHVLRAWLTQRTAIIHPFRKPFPFDASSAAAFLKEHLLGRKTSAYGSDREGESAGGGDD